MSECPPRESERARSTSMKEWAEKAQRGASKRGKGTGEGGRTGGGRRERRREHTENLAYINSFFVLTSRNEEVKRIGTTATMRCKLSAQTVQYSTVQIPWYSTAQHSSALYLTVATTVQYWSSSTTIAAARSARQRKDSTAKDSTAELQR